MATPREQLERLLAEEEKVKARLEYLAVEAQAMLEMLTRLLPLTVKGYEAWERWLGTFKSTVRLVGFEPAPGVGREENLLDLIGRLHRVRRDIEHFRGVIAREEAAER